MPSNTKEYSKLYYQTHKEVWKKDSSKVKHCKECNCDIKQYKYAQHCQTKKHKRNAGLHDLTFDDLMRAIQYLKAVKVTE